MNPLNKPGIYSSEFWLTVLGFIINMLVSTDLLTATGGSQLVDGVSKITVGIVTTVSVIYYSWLRAKSKTIQATLIAANPLLCTNCAAQLLPKVVIEQVKV